MRYLVVLLLLSGSLSSCGYNYNNPSLANTSFHKIRSIVSFSQVLKEDVDANTILLLDIDNTILTSKMSYGSVDFFKLVIREEIRKNEYTESEAKLRAYPRWFMSQFIAPTILVDNDIYKLIDHIKKKGALVLFFTARQSITAELTHNQLTTHSIYTHNLPGFCFEKYYYNQVFPEKITCQKIIKPNICKYKKFDISKAMFYKGILFSHDLNDKGKVFLDFYYALLEYTQTNNALRPKKVIIIDDNLDNLVSMEKIATKLGIKFIGYHIKNTFGFSPSEAKQEELMMKNTALRNYKAYIKALK